MEMSHRSKDYMGVRDEAEADLRALLSVPDDFAVLFVQGGAQGQNGLLPLNLIQRNGSGKADYVLSGSWSVKSCEEAQRYGDIHVAGTSGHAWQDQGKEWSPWTWFSEPSQWDVRPDAAYLHVCTNETIGGLQFDWIPQSGDVPLIADMSSDILSRPVDVSQYGMIYAGAQKNIGPSGLVVVIVREDLLGRARSSCPTMLDYKVAADNGSMYNTPACFSWYLSGLVFKWLKAQGGIEAMAKINHEKQRRLYEYIDNSALYNNPVSQSARSWMNVPFTLADAALDKAFLAGAEERRLLNLKGHRSVGGMRASIYNAVPLEAIDALIDYMKTFEKEHA